MENLKIHVLDRTELPYDGTQLAPHWIYKTFEFMGNSVVAFVGPANVELQNMVDLEDVKRRAPIFRQYLLVSEIYEALLERGISPMRRSGDDIYFQGRKLSVSIATHTLSSGLIHTGLNIETQGAPVPAAGLRELSVEPFDFARLVLERFREHDLSQRMALTKVLPRS
jgi:uncharacterized protein